jgi:hypothetical protein
MIESRIYATILTSPFWKKLKGKIIGSGGRCRLVAGWSNYW